MKRKWATRVVQAPQVEAYKCRILYNLPPNKIEKPLARDKQPIPIFSLFPFEVSVYFYFYFHLFQWSSSLLFVYFYNFIFTQKMENRFFFSVCHIKRKGLRNLNMAPKGQKWSGSNHAGRGYPLLANQNFCQTRPDPPRKLDSLNCKGRERD